MSTDPLMLSVSGCRGIFGSTMTPETAARFAIAAANHLRAQRAAAAQPARPLVVLGRDGRAGGDSLARAAASGLQAGGCDVLDAGVAMTPTVAVFADLRGADAGLIITASHNPQQWNGLKLVARSPSLAPGVVDACAPDRATADRVIALFATNPADSPPRPPQPGFSPVRSDVPPTDTGSYRALSRGDDGFNIPDEATYAHVEHLRRALAAIGVTDDRAHMGVRCVVDSVNSSGVAGSREFLGRRLVHHLGAGRSGLFPHTPEPLKENLTELASAVKSHKADVGFAQDPDADRLALIDERGEYIGEEYTLVLTAMAVLGAREARGESNEGSILCTNLSTSRMLEDVATKFGAKVVRASVGEANVVEAMKKHHAVMGGEGNGGVIWPEVTYIRDSLSGMALVIALMARTKKTVSQLVADIPAYSILKRKVDLPDLSVANRACEAVAKRFKDHRLDRQDGVRVDIDADRAWVHVRASNTEPIMRLIAEAPTRETAEKLLTETEAAIAKG
ncbi:MAG: hypothetical protein KF768_03255 [Phycisphaeraceae bacterium]|nr:hypothetical protein [Phycisphaeraceae bacterium]